MNVSKTPNERKVELAESRKFSAEAQYVPHTDFNLTLEFHPAQNKKNGLLAYHQVEFGSNLLTMGGGQVGDSFVIRPEWAQGILPCVMGGRVKAFWNGLGGVELFLFDLKAASRQPSASAAILWSILVAWPHNSNREPWSLSGLASVMMEFGFPRFDEALRTLAEAGLVEVRVNYSGFNRVTRCQKKTTEIATYISILFEPYCLTRYDPEWDSLEVTVPTRYVMNPCGEIVIPGYRQGVAITA